LWSVSITLMRALAARVPSMLQMLAQNAILLLACAAVLPWAWASVPWTAILLMIGVGIIGGAGQYLIFEAVRRAPASVTAPMEYTSLIWAFLLGMLIWGDIPPLTVFIGGAIILGSGALLIFTERQRQ
jgi:drug/metabolite transporter (DMT)-like permease